MTPIVFVHPDGAVRELSWPVVPRVGEDVYLFDYGKNPEGVQACRKLRVTEVGYTEGMERRSGLFETYFVPVPGCVVRVVLTDKEPALDVPGAATWWSTPAEQRAEDPKNTFLGRPCTTCGVAMFGGVSVPLCPECFARSLGASDYEDPSAP